MCGHGDDVDIAQLGIIEDRAIWLPLEYFCNSSDSTLVSTVSGIANDPFTLLFEDIDDIALNLDNAIPCRIRDVEDVNRCIMRRSDIENVIEGGCCSVTPIGREKDRLKHARFY
ncbi:hypothetical protein C450_19191 [Halococcus salifodinae DSM 8989]|uniref:Uncharacterized protein n=1 Tax=Halococcus salifodinae DSM 8989 TaxID=1227456 RepID=M0MSK4_9EURY|nr:hypothetical protein C450_19191 [Halococcus salifodinae DSM 8989]